MNIFNDDATASRIMFGPQMHPDAWCVHCYLMVDGCVQEVAEAAARARGELKDANIQLKAGYPYYSYCINIRVADPKPLKKRST